MSNTLAQLKELSNEELRIRVAKVVGWQPVGESYVLWKSPLQARGVTEGPWFPFSAVPNYPEDLNAMAAAERTLSDEEHYRFQVALRTLTDPDLSTTEPHTHFAIHDRNYMSASARDRAIAFLAVRSVSG